MRGRGGREGKKGGRGEKPRGGGGGGGVSSSMYKMSYQTIESAANKKNGLLIFG